MSKNLKELHKIIATVDVCMMTTVGAQGDINSRPMLCNHTDDSLSDYYFFCMKDSVKVEEIEANSALSLIFQDNENGFYADLMCTASVIDDTDKMAAHWDSKLETWWSEKEHTPNICMIRCQVHRIRYWYQGDYDDIAL